MRKTLRFLLSALLLLTAASASALTFTVDRITYTTIDTAAVPSCKVTGNTFEQRSPATVTIPSSVTDEGKTYAVTAIGKEVFTWISTSKITIPNSVTTIDEGAFSECYMDSVSLPESITTISKQMFYSCYKLQLVDIPKSVTTIGDKAFASCTSLLAVSIPSGVTAIGDSAFKDCTSLHAVYSHATVPPAMTQAFSQYDVPLFVPEGQATAYKTADGWKQFTDVRELNPASANNNPATFTVDRLCYFTADYVTCIVLKNSQDISSGDITIPATVTYNGATLTVNAIWRKAFEKCKELSAISLPSSIRTIEGNAFYGCTALSSVVIPEGVTTLESSAFAICYNLTSVSLPSTLTKIGGNAFLNSKSLNFIRVPAGVSAIGSNAFSGSCMGAIYMESATPPTFNGNLFPDDVTKIYVPAGSYAAYRNAAGWDGYSQIIEYDPADAGIQPQTCTLDSISYFISGITADTTCTVVYSPDAAYTGDITIPATVTSGGKTYRVNAIGMNVFLVNFDLTSIALPEGMTAIGGNAFNLSRITSAHMPSTLIHIGEQSFAACKRLTSMVIPDSVTDIGKSAFLYCWSMTSVTLGKKLTRIGSRAFAGCRKLESIYTCAATPPVMDDDAFSDYDIPLYVPTGTADAYKNADGWKLFTNISEFDVTGMDETLTGNNATKTKDSKFYDLNGIIVPTPVKNGVYINNGRKIVY